MEKDLRRKSKYEKSQKFFSTHKYASKKKNEDKKNISKSSNNLDNSDEFKITKKELKNIAEETYLYCELNKDKFYIGSEIYYPEEKNIIIDTSIYKQCDTKYIFKHINIIELMNKKNNTSNVAILVFASAKNPGGGFLKGTIGQEEIISYHTNLAFSEKNGNGFQMYERNKKNNKNYAYYSDIIFIPKLILFRDYNSSIKDESEWKKFNGVVCPAVNYTHFIKENSEEKYIEIMTNRFNNVLKSCLKNNCEEIVLGPWGCGIFGGKISTLMYIFKKNELLKYFKKVYFISINKDELCEMKKYFI